MNRYVDASEQLVVELYVRDIAASSSFYQAFGFRLVHEETDFVELKWEDTLLMLDASDDLTQHLAPLEHPIGNIRVMVPNVDDYWLQAQEMGAQVVRPIEDRSYGLRDFTIAGPDGLGLRFATRLSER